MAEVIKTVIDVELNTGQFASDLRALQQQINAFNLTLNKSQAVQGKAAKEWSDNLSAVINRTGYFKAELTKIQTSAAALDSTLKKGQATLGQFFSAAFNRRGAMAAEVFALASERARTMQTQFIATGKAAKGMQEVLAIRPLTAFSSEISIASQRMQILSSMFKQGTTQLINFGKNVQWAGRQLMVGFTVPLTIFGTTAGRVFMDLEKQVVSFKKVYGDLFTTPAELNANLEAVKGLAAEYTKYGIAVKDTVALAAQAAAAGMTNANLTDAVRETTRLATLGQMDQNSALETTIALQSAFKLSGQDLADTINFLNMVENQTVVSLQDISAAIPRVAPVVQGLGGDVKDLTVFLAAMQEGGVSAEQGANALKSGLASLINPTKSATSFLGKFGINLDYIIQQNKGDLMGTVMDFARALQTLDEFTRQQALENVFGKFQYAKLAPLFDNITRSGSQASRVMDTMGYSSEQLAATANKELGTIEQSFGVQLTAAIEKFKLAIAPIGELFIKMAIPVVNMITKMINWFNGLPDSVKNFGAVAAVITGVIVPAATMLFGLFMNLVGTLAKMTQGVVIFGATWKKSGLIAAFQTLTQSSKYLSLAEIDAANAAQQLGSATAIANKAILEQAATQNSSRVAIDAYTNALLRQVAVQREAALLNPTMFARGAGAAGLAKNIVKRSTGGIVPGSGNTDTVPAMLTGGEFVVNKQATKQNMGLLKAINNGYNAGGVVTNARNSYGFPPSNTQLREYIDKLDILDKDNKWSTNIKNQPVGDRKSFKVFKDAIDFIDRNGEPGKGKEFVDNLLAEATKKNKRIGTKDIYKVFEDLYGIPAPNRRGAADVAKRTEKIGQLGGFDIRRMGGNVHASHTGAPRKAILESDMMFGQKGFKAGVPVKILKNRVMDLPDWMNLNLNRSGVTGEDLYNYINSNKGDVLSTQRQQFVSFLKTKKFSPPQIGLAVEQTYEQAEKQIVSKLLELLNAKKKDTFTDADFGSLVDKAYSPLIDSDETLLRQFNRLINVESVIRLGDTKQIVDRIKELGGTPVAVGGKNPKLAYLEQLLGMLGVEKGSSDWNKFISYAEGGTRVKEETFSMAKSKGLSAIFYDKAKRVVRKASAIKRRGLNAGGLASTNKDTVPAMLTPGEFVINKKAAQANMPLLNAINNGQRLNKGGMVKGGILYAQEGTNGGVPKINFSTDPRMLALNQGALGPTSQIPGQAAFAATPGKGGMLRGALPTVAGIAAQMGLFGPLMAAGNKLAGTMGGLAASMIGTTAVSGLVQYAMRRMVGSPIKLGEQFAMTSKVLSFLKPQFLKIGLVGGGWIAAASGLAAVTYGVIKNMNNIRNAGSKLTEAMYGGVNSVNNMAAAFGRETPTQQLTAMKAQAAGGAVGQQAQQQASQFIGTDAGKQLIKDMEVAKKNGEDAAQALRNQLTRSIVAGVITPEEARGVAIQIGNALNDQKLAVDASAGITALVGPNGELIKDNRIKIIAEISPELDSADLIAQATKQYEEGTKGFFGKIQSFFDNRSTEIATNAMRNLSTSVSNYALIQKQNMDNLELQMMQGTITLEQYNKEVEKLDENARQFNSKSLTSFLEITGAKDIEQFNALLKETTTVKGPRGDITYSTDAAKKAQAQVMDQVKQMQDAYFAQIPNITEEQKIATIESMKAAFGGPESTEIISGWAQVLSGYISMATVKGLANGAPDGIRKRDLDAMRRDERANAEEIAKIKSGMPPVDDGKESAWERIKRETEETKKYSAAVQGLLGSGLKPENIALLNQADLLELSNTQRKEAIKLLKDQQQTSKVLAVVLMSTEEQNIKNLNDAVKVKDYEISLLQREIDKKLKLNQVEEDRIDNLSRQNELDKREIESRNRSLEQIAKKEETVNSVYDARFAALDKVAQANDRIAQQQQNRISLAGALTGGDFGAAASAAAQMSSAYATAQLEDTRSALENQRQSELASLTAEVNGQLLTKKDIQLQIDQINERIYQRDQAILSLEDIIYQRERETIPYKQQIQALEDQRLSLTQKIEDAEYNRWKTELDGINKAILAYNNYWKSKTKGTGTTVGTNVKASAAQANSFGGMIRAANGMEVPGTGITDKVPALLTPGEFVVRKSVAQANMPLLKALNSDVFPNASSLIGTPEIGVSDNSISTVNAPVYNNYSVNVSVTDTNASANDIASAVISKIKMNQGRSIRGSRV